MRPDNAFSITLPETVVQMALAWRGAPARDMTIAYSAATPGDENAR